MNFKKRYKAEALKRLSDPVENSFLTVKEIEHLPNCVQKYLYACGAMNHPIVHNFHAAFRGQMKNNYKSRWMKISAQQYNFIHEPSRLFYIRSSILGIPYEGLHLYNRGKATMEISIASLFRVVNASGEKLNKGETVTLFNDLCFYAPSALADPTISWQEVDSLKVKATFTLEGNIISALLYFSPDGMLIDFISYDRFYSADGKTYINYPWSTPVLKHVKIRGRTVPSVAEAIWHTEEAEFIYAKFELQKLEYNCTRFE